VSAVLGRNQTISFRKKAQEQGVPGISPETEESATVYDGDNRKGASGEIQQRIRRKRGRMKVGEVNHSGIRFLKEKRENVGYNQAEGKEEI